MIQRNIGAFNNYYFSDKEGMRKFIINFFSKKTDVVYIEKMGFATGYYNKDNGWYYGDIDSEEIIYQNFRFIYKEDL